MSTGAGWKTYRDFVLKIERAGEGRYRVEAQAPTGEAQASFERPFDQRDLELFLLKVGHPRKVPTRRLPEEAQDAVEFGTGLYRAVICDEVRELFRRARYEAARSGQGLRVQLRLADAPELADWPWEFLNDGRDFLALSADTPIVRYLDLPEPPRPLQVQPPLRILVTVSAPQGLPELDVEQEKAKLLESLAALSERGTVTVDFTPDATLRTLQSTLRRARSEGRPYHVWHYIGHGAYMRSRSASVLAFCTPEGLLHRVGDLELGTLFGGYPEMRLVLLNACEGARPDPQDPFAGVAAALVRRGVPAVIGMQIEISDEAARTLSQVFYEALVDGLPVDAALTEARRAVFFAPNWTEWATPVLYMRAPDGRIFDVTALAPVRPARRDRASEAEVSEAEVSVEEVHQERLADLYTEALEAYYAARWSRAIEVLDDIVALRADYRRAATMLEEARRQHALAEGYARGSAAYDAQDWAEAIEHLEAVVALNAGYRDAGERLRETRHRKELADLYADARQLHQAQRWQAAIQALESIQDIEPDYLDSERLLGSAREALEAEEYTRNLADLYGRGLEHIDAQEWSEALDCLKRVAQLEQGYRETDALLARARQELEAQDRARKLAELYSRGLEHIDAQEWPEALKCLEQVAGLEQGYRETESLLARVRQELEPARPIAQPFAKPGARSWPVWMWVVLGAVALLFLGGGILLVRYYIPVWGAARSAARAVATSAARATPAPDAGTTRVREKDDAVMLYVPAGAFQMGSGLGDFGADGAEKPRHRVFVEAFWIDRTEVTNAQYRQCVEAGACSPPQDSSSYTRENYYGNSEYDDYPVVNVTWHQAREYAAWVGGRLPTEAEWEYACRGPDGYTYPWGNRPPDDTLLNYEDNVGDTTQVGSYSEGKSWCGTLDMGGNVWEWTQSRYVDYPYDLADGRESLGAGGDRVVRGGAFYVGARGVRCAYRGRNDPVYWDRSFGLRVVLGPG